MKAPYVFGTAALGGILSVAALIGVTSAQTTSPTPAVPSASATVTGTGTPTSNEDATHEANETPEQEAAEHSGTGHMGRHGGKSNEDAAHEASETAEQEAAEDAAASATATP